MPCADASRLAWVGAYPLDLSRPTTREFLRNQGLGIFPPSGRAYHVRTFEVDRQLIEDDVSIGETELINASSQFAFDDEGLIDTLERMGMPVERLELRTYLEAPLQRRNAQPSNTLPNRAPLPGLAACR